LLDEEAAPLGLLAAEDPPLMPPLLEDVPPLDEDPPIPPPLDDEEPVPLELGLLGLELLELEEPGELGAVLVEDDEEPPGTTTVSFSLVVELVLADPLGEVLLPPGTTVVVSLRSQADNASRAPATTKTTPLRFMFTLLSSEDRCKLHRRFSNCCAGSGPRALLLQPFECGRPYHQLLLVKSLLERPAVGGPPIAFEHFHHYLAHHNFVAVHRLAHFPSALGWRPEVGRDAAIPLGKLVANPSEVVVGDGTTGAVVQRQKQLDQVHPGCTASAPIGVCFSVQVGLFLIHFQIGIFLARVQLGRLPAEARDLLDVVGTDVAVFARSRLATRRHVLACAHRIRVAVQIGVTDIRAGGSRGATVDIVVRTMIESDHVAFDNTRRASDVARTVTRVARTERAGAVPFLGLAVLASSA
jgi:hypothetical protein